MASIFADNISKCIFLNEKNCTFVPISIEYTPKGPIINMPVLVQMMAWHRTGDKPLSEPVVA